MDPVEHRRVTVVEENAEMMWREVLQVVLGYILERRDHDFRLFGYFRGKLIGLELVLA